MRERGRFLRRIRALLRSDRLTRVMPEPDTIEHRNARAIADWQRRRGAPNPYKE